ncbi:MAG: AMP-binding protein [Rhodobacteraceae bacterium]|nr:AMP-binding protein [Paracoccaceae bacterium]
MYDLSLSEAYCPAQTDATVQDTTLVTLLRDAAARAPDAPALQGADEEGVLGRVWTYRDLCEDAERLARALLSRFKPGERVAVWSPNTPEWLLLEYAAGFAGLTLVTVNPAYQARELEYVLTQSEAAGLFLIRTYRGNPMWDIAQSVVQDLPGLREVVDLDDHASLFAGEDQPVTLPDVKPDDPAQIQYTSGTTGFPKGAMLHHRGITNNARMIFDRYKVSRGDVVLNFMPMFHTSGCAIIALGALQYQCKMIVAKLFSPPHMLDIVQSEKATTILGVPTMLIGLIEEQKASPRNVSSVFMVCSGGSLVPPELVRAVRSTFDCGFQTIYGQTEASPVITQTRDTDSLEDLCSTVGQPLPCIEVSIRHPQENTLCAIDEIGEICSRGFNTMLGYNNNPEATAATVDPDGWLHTGDLGTMDTRGYVRVTGRVKEMIIRGGENLFPAEIETVLLEHPDISETAVVGVPDPKWGEIVACFMRPAQGATLDKDVLLKHCRAHLSPQKTPALWIEVAEWPLTGSGKIRKFVLRDDLGAGKFTPL